MSRLPRFFERKATDIFLKEQSMNPETIPYRLLTVYNFILSYQAVIRGKVHNDT
jgi:hypothetical protein